MSTLFEVPEKSLFCIDIIITAGDLYLLTELAVHTLTRQEFCVDIHETVRLLGAVLVNLQPLFEFQICRELFVHADLFL